MATTRYGPARMMRGDEDEDEAKAVDDADPNAMMLCPYDSNHRIRACRFPYHIIKCAKNHPKLAKAHKTCPFNAKHVVPTHQLAHHIEHCKDKCLITMADDDSASMNPKFHVPSMWTAPECEEDWDKEADENAETFVWGVTNNLLLVNQPEQPVTNNLKAGIRAPRTLPGKF
ncbi:gametocyte-specific factor 1 isoform X1 [Tachysurus fulvidraco]|uniref:gametocyte-specific factor 1 isoform X1 n=1 Tax=Tachysurus fulvidraco TaxID=1234273 RepID=UPI000F4FCC01|nr:gametocyte-specific factor 1 isoform X1 [Tachysurus fulvidraco]XP_026990352.1 gametocyte-specific factor 1 isoform X1 [Tachysurus fulvidraco]